MALGKKVLFLMLAFTSLNVSANELVDAKEATPSSGSYGSIKTGDLVWINGLCKRVTASGDLEIVPLNVAKSAQGCQALRDYTEVDKAYSKVAQVAKPCGNIDLRKAAEQATCQTTKGTIFQLVKRTSDGKEVWKDTKSGLIWSDRLDKTYSQYNALNACSDYSTMNARGNLEYVSFSLPSKADFETAENDGIREVLPNMKDHYFWSSSVFPYDSYVAYGFGGSYSGFVAGFRSNGNSVRCVGR